MTMSDYKEYVYDEAFADSITSFDAYVQESALLVGGIIAGVVAFIGLIVLLIKKIFFSTDTAQGSSASVVRILKSVESLLESPHGKTKITVEQGFALNNLTSDELKIMIEAANENIKAVLENPSLFVVSPKKLDDLMAAIKEAEALSKKIYEEQFIRRTYNIEDLKTYVKRELEGYKRAADAIKELDKNMKQVKKSDSLNDNQRKSLTIQYEQIVKSFNTEHDQWKKWYKNIKAGLANGGGD